MPKPTSNRRAFAVATAVGLLAAVIGIRQDSTHLAGRPPVLASGGGNAETLYGNAAPSGITIPAEIAIGPTYAVELAVRVNFNCAGTVSGMWFYRTSSDTGTISVAAWNGASLVASGSGNPSAGPGWRFVAFSLPYTVSAGAQLMLGVYHPNGAYAYRTDGFTSPRSLGSPYGCMTAPSGSGGAPNSMYEYVASPPSVRPTLSYLNSEYFQSPEFTRVDTTGLKIMAIGDSITEDNPANLSGADGSWRSRLSTSLTAAGRNVKFYGSHQVDSPRTTGNIGHEAFGGWATCDFFPPPTGRLSVRDYVHEDVWTIADSIEAVTPDVIIADIGTNNYIDDLFEPTNGYNDCPGTAPNFAAFFDVLVNAPNNPRVVVTTVEDASVPNGTDYINTIISNYVTAKQAIGKQICLATLPSSFSGLTITGDRFHLNTAGKNAVASALLTPTQNAIDSNCTATPATTTTSSSTTTTTILGSCVPGGTRRPVSITGPASPAPLTDGSETLVWNGPTTFPQEILLHLGASPVSISSVVISWVPGSGAGFYVIDYRASEVDGWHRLGVRSGASTVRQQCASFPSTGLKYEIRLTLQRLEAGATTLGIREIGVMA